MKKNLSDLVLQKINQEDLRPVSLWYFRLKKVMLLFGVFLFGLFGVLSSAIIFHFLNNFEFVEFVARGPRVLMKAFWFGIPFLWMFCLGLSLLFAITFVRHTGRGYRRGILFWLFFFLSPQVVGGYFLEDSAVGERLDEAFSRRISMYESLPQRKDRFWGNPEEGFLAGEIKEVHSDSLLILEDRRQTIWEVDFSDAKVAKHVEMAPKERVRIFGNLKEDQRFEADRIIPFHPPKGGRKGWRNKGI